MSTKLTGYVWDGCAASGMKLSSVAIMARLADFSNDEGVCWPSIETIARQIGAGMSTVRTAIARLEAEGWLTRKARRQGITKPELEAYLREILNSKNKSGLAFCSDEEGLLVDGVIASVLMNDDYRSLYSVIVDRYRLRKSKLQMANELQAKHPDWPLITCRRRIDTWLSLAESILYAPVCDAFGTNSDRFKLQSEQESA